MKKKNRLQQLEDMVTRPGFILVWSVLLLWGFILIIASNSAAMTTSLTFLTMSLVAFAAAVVNEVMTRRRWENNIIQHFDKLKKQQDTLTSENKELIKQAEQIKLALSMVIDQLQKPFFQTGKANNNILQKVKERSTIPDNIEDQIKSAIRRERLDILLQPVVRLPQRKTAFYEVHPYLSLEDGRQLQASRFMTVAREKNLLSSVENLFLLKSLQLIRTRQKIENASVDYFIRLDLSALSQSTVAADLADFLAENRHLAGRLVFDMSQKDYIAMKPPLRSVLIGLVRLGCRFSMDHIFDLSLDPRMLKKNNISFIKVRTTQLLQYMNRADGRKTLLDLKRALDEGGIDLIARDVDHEDQLESLSSLTVDFGQGFLFGEPGDIDQKAA